MKRKYKLLIVCAVSVVLLLCSVISVGAASSNTSTFYYGNIGNITQIKFYWGSGSDEIVTNGHIIEQGHNSSGLYALNLASPSYDSSDLIPPLFYSVSFNVVCDSEFLESVSFYDDLTLSLKAGQRPGFSSEYSQVESITITLYDSSSHTVSKSVPASNYKTGDMQSTTIVFTDDELDSLEDIHVIRYHFYYVIEDGSGIPEPAGVWFMPYVTYTYTELADNYLTEGWKPNPEKPSGSESVDDMTDIEQEIMDGSQEGIDSGNQVLSNFGGFLENWREGFIFAIGLFNILFANTWINSLIQIGLALGLIAFILNIAPSIARKISSGKKGGAK